MKMKLTLVILSVVLFALYGCGIKGPLYMPQRTSVVKQVDQENMSSNSQENLDSTSNTSKATEHN